MRLFANAGPISKILEKSMSEGEELEHGMLNWSIENAQKKVEQQNFSIRKRLLQFDDVLNTQREVIYGIRNEAIQSDTPRDIINEMIEEELELRLENLDADTEEQAMERFLGWLNAYFPIALQAEELHALDLAARQALILERIAEAYTQREAIEGKEALVGLERYIVLRSIDRRWQDHLTEMEELRRAVNLRGYGQKDPLSEYKSEAYGFFEELMSNVRTEICNGIFRSATTAKAFEAMLSRMAVPVQQAGPAQGQPSALAAAAAQSQPTPTAQPQKPVELPKVEPIRRELPKIGRNETVTIRKGGEEQQVKFKKAEPMIHNQGWELVQK